MKHSGPISYVVVSTLCVLLGTIVLPGGCCSGCRRAAPEGADNPNDSQASVAGQQRQKSITGLTAVALDGQPVPLERFAGKPAILDFWATWCPPCRQQRQILEQLRADPSSQVTVVALSVDENPATVSRYLEGHASLGTELMAPADLAAAFGVTSIPTLVFVDSSGRVRHVGAGVHSLRELKRNVASFE